MKNKNHLLIKDPECFILSIPIETFRFLSYLLVFQLIIILFNNTAVAAASQRWSNERMIVKCSLMMVKCLSMMVKCSSMMVKWLYDHTLISPSLNFISPSLTCILPSLASSKPPFAHSTIIEKLYRLYRAVLNSEK